MVRPAWRRMESRSDSERVLPEWTGTVTFARSLTK